MNLWPVEHFFPQFGVPVYCKVPQIEEKSVQLVRGSFVKKWLLKKSSQIMSQQETLVYNRTSLQKRKGKNLHETQLCNGFTIIH